MTRIGGILLCLAAVPAAPRAAAQVALETEPATPGRGTLIRLHVTPMGMAAIEGVDGVLADEPLHFRMESGTAWSALAGIPIEGGDTVPVLLVLRRGEIAETVQTTFAVSRGDYGEDRLSVAPRMAEPDSAARIRIARDNARARRVTRAAHLSPRLWDVPFAVPRTSRITSGYGTARIFNGRMQSRHLGTDFNGQLGDTVRAPSRGRVALRDDFYLAGKVVYLDHGEGLVSAYFHLSRALVARGDIVERGQPIGLVGRSGRVTGPHLHWVTRYGGVSVDPMSVVGLLVRE